MPGGRRRGLGCTCGHTAHSRLTSRRTRARQPSDRGATSPPRRRRLVSSLTSLLLIAVLCSAAPSAASAGSAGLEASNLIGNPGFEVDTAGWEPGSSSTALARVAGWALRELRGAALELVGRRAVLARGRPELGSRHAERSLHHRDLGPFRRSRSELQVAHPRVLGRLTGRIDLVDRLDDLDLAAGDRGLHAGGSRAVSSGLPGLHLEHARGCLLRGRRRVPLRWARRPTASRSRSATRPPPH